MSHLVILGGGPAGYVAAVRARQLGADVTLVEMDKLGGTCLNRGCIPSKALLKCAEVARLVQRTADFGVELEPKGVNWAAVQQHKDRVVSQLLKGVEFLMKENGIRVIRGRGRLTEPLALTVETGEKEERVEGDKLLLCPGSLPSRLPIPGGDLPSVLTSDEMLKLGHIPESVAIIGGGVIGAEFADIFSSFGVKVSIIEMLPRIVSLEDEEISKELARAFRKRKIDVFCEARVEEISERAGRHLVRFDDRGKSREVEAELVLCAVGRRPNTDDIGLSEVGLELEKGFIKVNSQMGTNLPGVYAAGDVIGGFQLAHVAWMEGKVAVGNALGGSREMDYTAVPAVTFTHPEIGSVGLSESEAKARGLETKVGRFHFRAVGKAVAEGERDGLVKVVSEAATGKVVGAHIIGLHATDIIHELTLAIQLGVTVEQIGDTIHAHPTLAEAVGEAVEDSLGQAIHK